MDLSSNALFELARDAHEAARVWDDCELRQRAERALNRVVKRHCREREACGLLEDDALPDGARSPSEVVEATDFVRSIDCVVRRAIAALGECWAGAAWTEFYVAATGPWPGSRGLRPLRGHLPQSICSVARDDDVRDELERVLAPVLVPCRGSHRAHEFLELLVDVRARCDPEFAPHGAGRPRQ
jgi:hypothetical protein